MRVVNGSRQAAAALIRAANGARLAPGFNLRPLVTDLTSRHADEPWACAQVTQLRALLLGKTRERAEVVVGSQWPD